MSTTAPGPSGPPPPPPPPGSHRRLVRLHDQQKVAGVSAGLGWYFGIDPTLFRIAFVVLAITGGVGIVLYLAAALIMPRSTTWEEGPQPPPRDADSRTWAIAGLAILAGVVLISEVGGLSGNVTWAAVLIGIGVLLFTRQGDAPPAPPPPLPPPPPRAEDPFKLDVEPPPGGWAFPPPWEEVDSAYGPYAGAYQEPPPVPEPPRRPRSLLGRLTFAAWLLAVGGAALLDRWGAVDLNPLTFVALSLLVVGAGLVVGGRFGRGRGLIVVGLALIPVLLVVNAVTRSDVRIPLHGGVGERNISITSPGGIDDEYQLFAGSLTLDLTEIELDGATARVQAGVGMGELVVLVPDDVAVAVEGHVGAGDARVLDLDREGVDITLDATSSGVEGRGRIELALRVGLGEVSVSEREVDRSLQEELQ